MIDRRGVSSAVTYALVVAITLTLTTGLLFGTETLIQQNREQAATDQLEVVEQRVATTIETTHRLASTDDPDPNPERVRVVRRLPDRLAGSQYRIEIVDVGGTAYVLRLELVDIDVTTRTTMDLTVEAGDPTVAETTLNGGDIAVVYDPGANELEVRRA